MGVEETYIQAAMNRKIVELVDQNGRSRIVEPYMIYSSTGGERLLHCYQLGGFSRTNDKEPSGWRNPKLSELASARILQGSYKPRKGYNPNNRKLFPEISFALPREGTPEPAAAPPAA